MTTVGRPNPLPPLRPRHEIHRVENLDELPPAMRHRITHGTLHSTLPCLDQDGYDRSLSPGTLPALVLENAHLRATVLPGLGGRLYALLDKDSGRDLVYRNPVLQPANLALRNAWFAGGVEWNLGSTGHTTLTCGPLHAAAFTAPDGTPGLRLWEWERTRELVMQLDFWLPAGSRHLLVGVRVRNPHPEAVPAYWWSNIAVEQTPGMRVLVPAEHAWHFGYDARLRSLPVPWHDGIDLSYPMRHQRAADYFFQLPEGQQPWIAAVDESGAGLMHTSTARLRGRKLFVWGENRGGRRWQEWLSPGSAGHGYAEIQAGLATTQLEHLSIPPRSEWTWLESYGPVQVPPELVHGDDWTSAWQALDAATSSLESRHAEWLRVADQEPGERLAAGSGWGALEVGLSLPGTPFGEDTLGEEQRPWRSLLDGAMPVSDPLEPPGGTLVSRRWRALLAAAEPNWLVSYHRGVAQWHAGDAAGAVAHWRQSLHEAESPWAQRSLAVAAMVLGDAHEVLHRYERALELSPGEPALAVEAVETLLELDLVNEAAAFLERSRMDMPRLRLARVRVLLATGRAAEAEALLDEGIELADLREGANLLADLWTAVQQQLGAARPLPQRYDFRMR